MKVRTFIITASATLALVAPAAAANAAAAKADPVVYDAIPSKPAVSGHKIIHRLVIGKKHTVKKQNHTAKKQTGKRSTRVGTPRFIYVAPQPQTQASSDDGVNNCTDYMVDCTDQQLCDTWGFNCDSVGSSGSSNDSQVEAAQVDSSASDAATSAPALVASVASNPASPSVDNTTAVNYDDC